jgi:tetratricopeptide (TPR) repeat protein
MSRGVAGRDERAWTADGGGSVEALLRAGDESFNRGEDLRAAGSPVTALEHYRRAARDYGTAGAWEAAAESFIGLAETLTALNKPADARAAYQDAIDVVGERDEPEARDVVGHCLAAIGESWERSNDPERAISVYRRSRAIYLAVGDTAEAARLLVNIGNTLVDLDEHAEAEQLFHEAQGVLAAAGRLADVARVQVGLGNIAFAADQPARAAAYYEAGAAALAECGLPRQYAAAETNLANARAVLDDVEGALAGYDRAREILRETGPPPDLADASVGSAIVLTRMGRHQEALDRYREARALYEGSGARRDVARCDVSLAALLNGIGAHDDAIRHYEAARVAYREVGSTVDVASCDMGMGGSLANLYDRALLHDGDKDGSGERGRALLERARSLLAEAMEVFTTNDLVVRRSQCALTLAGVLDDLGEVEAARTCLADAAASADSPYDQGHIAMTAGNLVSRAGRHEEAATWFRRARAHFTAAGMALQVADNEHNLAATYLRWAVELGGNPSLRVSDPATEAELRRMLGVARAAAIRGLRTADAARYGLRHPSLRRHWAEQAGRTHALALHLAELLADAELAAELLESARARALPDPAGLLAGGADAVWTVDGEMALVQPAAISVRGRSALARGGRLWRGPRPDSSARGASARGEQPPDERVATSEAPERQLLLSLEEMTAAAAGPGAWLWSSWELAGRLWWAIVPPDGQCFAGDVPMDARSDAGLGLARLAEILPPRPVARDDSVSLGTAVAHTDPEREHIEPEQTTVGSERVAVDPERRLAADLGAALLPEPLRREMLRRLATGAPRLVLGYAPAPRVAHVPVGLLALADDDSTPDDGPAADHDPTLDGGPDTDTCDAAATAATADLPRVLDIADLTLMPSCAVTAAVATRPAEPIAAPLPLAALVVDPLDDLPNVRRLPELLAAEGIEAAVTLGGVTVRKWRPDSLAAGRASVLSFLAGQRAGSDAMAVYAGHATSATPAMPTTGALVLAPPTPGEPDLFTAHELMSAWAAGTAALPRRVVLAGCSTSGADAAGGGEWWGLAPAMLLSGARTVVATLWDVRDAPATTAFAAAVTAALRVHPNPAEAIAALQRDMLARWRRAPDATLAPLYWAPWVVVGVYGG